MKLCTYRRITPLGSYRRLGIFFNETTLFDPNLCWQAYYQNQGFYHVKEKAHAQCPATLSELLKSQEKPLEQLLKSFELYKSLAKDGVLKTKDGALLAFDLKDEEEVFLDCPVDQINCYRDFYIHEKHVAKGFEKRNEPIPEAWYEIPAYYKGPTTGFIGHQQQVLWPHYSKKLDYELELACVIGKEGKNIKEGKAYEHILGFSILNDISARDIQKKEMAVRLGPAKGKDFCSVLGPVITTIDEFNHKEPELLMTATINGEEWSRGYSHEGHYTWAEMIAHASMEEWLLPTDVLGSGTVGTGCGLELDKWIKPGDTIELFVDKIGTLKNTIGYPKK